MRTRLAMVARLRGEVERGSQDGVQLKTSELLISVTVPLILLNCRWLWVTDTVGRETTGRERPLNLYQTLVAPPHLGVGAAIHFTEAQATPKLLRMWKSHVY